MAGGLRFSNDWWYLEGILRDCKEVVINSGHQREL